MILKQPGTRLAAFALGFVLLGALLMPLSFADQYFFPSFAVFILIELSALTRKMKATQMQRNQAQMNAAQLEISLLRKNIQPHFILNTLTSIEQWIEESPQTAVAFIDSLVD